VSDPPDQYTEARNGPLPRYFVVMLASSLCSSPPLTNVEENVANSRGVGFALGDTFLERRHSLVNGTAEAPVGRAGTLVQTEGWIRPGGLPGVASRGFRGRRHSLFVLPAGTCVGPILGHGLASPYQERVSERPRDWKPGVGGPNDGPTDRRHRKVGDGREVGKYATHSQNTGPGRTVPAALALSKSGGRKVVSVRVRLPAL
jgi:hypothetical protein